MRYFVRIHLCKSKTLLAEVFQRRTYQVEFLVVDDEETVVESFVVAYGELRILGVEGRDVGGGNLVVRYMLLVVVLRREDREPHAFAFLRKEVEHLRVRPVVDENERPLRARDERQHQRPRVHNCPS